MKPDDSAHLGADSGEALVSLGRVIKAHGLRGQVKVVPLVDNPDRFESLRSVCVEFPDGSISRMEVEKAKIQADIVILRLAGIEDRTAAEALAGSWISVPKSEVQPLEDDSYYVFDLVGMEVLNEEAVRIGVITRIEEFPANAVLVVESDSEELWIPAVKELVVNVDMESKRMTLRLPEGLPVYPKRTE